MPEAIKGLIVGMVWGTVLGYWVLWRRIVIGMCADEAINPEPGEWWKRELIKARHRKELKESK